MMLRVGLSNMDIRLAHPNEASRLSEIAHQAKRHWGYPEAWIRAWEAELTLTAVFIEQFPVFVIEIDGGIAGFCALSDAAGEWEIEHFWILPAFMGRGAGARLFRHAAAALASRGIKRFKIVSDPHAEGFYQKMGARRVGAVTSSIPGRALPVLMYEMGVGELMG